MATEGWKTSGGYPYRSEGEAILLAASAAGLVTGIVRRCG